MKWNKIFYNKTKKKLLNPIFHYIFSIDINKVKPIKLKR